MARGFLVLLERAAVQTKLLYKIGKIEASEPQEDQSPDYDDYRNRRNQSPSEQLAVQEDRGDRCATYGEAPEQEKSKRNCASNPQGRRLRELHCRGD